MSDEYPKIDTLYDRDERFKVNPSKERRAEFAIPREWLVTEKIDGTNVRVEFESGGPQTVVKYKGRTDNAQMSPVLLEALEEALPWDVIPNAFEPGVAGVLYGEGYGPKIQKGGVYGSAVSFRLFDIQVGEWWLNWSNVEDVAAKLGVKTVPVLAEHAPLIEAVRMVPYPSKTASEDGGDASWQHEGIVCRTDPLLFCRDGSRLMWKLKGKDFGA